jgi:hypothetical protein
MEAGEYMKPEYNEGPEARKKFEDGMKKLFQAPKDTAKQLLKPKPKRKKTSKDQRLRLPRPCRDLV